MRDLFGEAMLDQDYKCPTEDTFSYPDLHGPLCIDTETHDPLLKKRGAGWAYSLKHDNPGKIVGVAIMCDNLCEYLPIGHAEGNMDSAKVRAWLAAQLRRDPRQPKIFANALYDVGWLEVEGMPIPHDHVLEDIMFQAPLLDENRLDYSLDKLGKEFLGFGKDERLLKQEAERLGVKNSKNDNIKTHMMRVNPNVAGVYARQDVNVTLQLWHRFRRQIEEQSLGEVYGLEIDLIPMLIAMRRRGVRVDVEEAIRENKIFLDQENEARRLIKNTTGVEVESWDNANELAVVFEKLGIQYSRTEKSGQPSITQGWLRSLKHEIADAILMGRKASNFRSTFIENAILALEQNGRVYPNFNPLRRTDDSGASGVIGKELKSGTKGALSGRFSSSNPNFQQIPSPEKDPEMGYMVRKLFLPEEGEAWHSLDYSSQEPRLIVHFAEVTRCLGAPEVAQQFRDNPRSDWHLANARLLLRKKPDFAETPEKARKPVKIIGLGIAYGMGGGKLAFSLGLPYYESSFVKNGKVFEFLRAGPEAEEILRAFDEAAPYIKMLARKCQNAVRKKGYIVTPTGRRFRFPQEDNGQYMFLNKALNRLIQGTAADMTKLSLRALWREGILPLGTVHDENCISTSDPEVVRRAIHIMENALPISIPVVVDHGSGINWGDASDPKKGAEFAEKFMEKMAA